MKRLLEKNEMLTQIVNDARLTPGFHQSSCIRQIFFKNPANKTVMEISFLTFCWKINR